MVFNMCNESAFSYQILKWLGLTKSAGTLHEFTDTKPADFSKGAELIENALLRLFFFFLFNGLLLIVLFGEGFLE